MGQKKGRGACRICCPWSGHWLLTSEWWIILTENSYWSRCIQAKKCYSRGIITMLQVGGWAASNQSLQAPPSFFSCRPCSVCLARQFSFLPRSTWEVISRLLPWWWLAVINSAVITGILRTKKLLSICVDNFYVFILCVVCFSLIHCCQRWPRTSQERRSDGLTCMWIGWKWRRVALCLSLSLLSWVIWVQQQDKWDSWRYNRLSLLTCTLLIPQHQ